ncbi:MAG: hypothetical protein DMF76_21630 [Acidobacteria bacterium]|nr:MAG: hypothetical protein DMF76_21630 [Acidobacteriota bacterium]
MFDIMTIMPSARRLLLVAITISLLGFALSISAQSPGNPGAPSNPTMVGRRLDDDKEALYAQFTDYKRNPNPEQQRYAYPTAKAYLRRFGGDTDNETKEVQRFVAEYERAMHEHELYAVYGAKNYLKTFELGRPLLKSDPENFFALGIMAEAGYDSALTGNGSLNVETIDYAKRAIRLIEDNKVSKADPFKSMDIARGFLNFALGWFLKDEDPVAAAVAFTKAVQTDSPYRTDPAAYHRLGISILRGEFTQFSALYNEKFGNKPPSPEQTAMLERIKHLAGRAIDAYARAVALSTRPEQQDAKNKILVQLSALYKNFHNGSDASLNELISTVLSKPMP